MLHILLLFGDHGICKLLFTVTNSYAKHLYIFISYLKMTCGRSKLSNVLSLVFIIKSISEKLLLNFNDDAYCKLTYQKPGLYTILQNRLCQIWTHTNNPAFQINY